MPVEMMALFYRCFIFSFWTCYCWFGNTNLSNKNHVCSAASGSTPHWSVQTIPPHAAHDRLLPSWLHRSKRILSQVLWTCFITIDCLPVLPRLLYLFWCTLDCPLTLDQHRLQFPLSWQDSVTGLVFFKKTISHWLTGTTQSQKELQVN